MNNDLTRRSNGPPSAVEETTERIAASPGAGTPLAGGFRKRLVAGFPFSTVYRIWDEQVFLVAVAV